ncbi:Low affinity iron permease, Fet4 [Metarhizium album ARSEF 1941]|uniref:Low affinity iron permease, Fet4 n=1 Tax=Metarhizium album (strain ARSEF 1941) TaxID=1081103 RepID=A0A0B2WJB6_METAS|nr:Low affinity iron permease, Fet4 [Metarhizium album ARSEF 1941]KHN96136.1 Low affinity iron permease, Fet4 [Metarhizium album ARSEF 1941]
MPKTRGLRNGSTGLLSRWHLSQAEDIEKEKSQRFTLGSGAAEEKHIAAVVGEPKEDSESPVNIAGYMTPTKPGRLDRCLDALVTASGSEPILPILAAGLLAWAFAGTRYGEQVYWAGLASNHLPCLSRPLSHYLHAGHTSQWEGAAPETVKLKDAVVPDEIGVPAPEKATVNLSSVNRLSNAMGIICAHEFAVIWGVVVAMALVVGASTMAWTNTGQLLCHIPPSSIVETFLMVILIAARNFAEAAW